MGRLLDWIVPALIVAMIISVVMLATQPKEKSPDVKRPEALSERVERLEAEVDMLRSQVEAVQARAEHRLTLMEARVAIVDARVQALERVVPVEAIRDRARQR